VISRDKGFDPLVEYMRRRGLDADRVGDIAEIPLLRREAVAAADQRIMAVVADLGARGGARPRKVQTLYAAVAQLSTPALDESATAAIIEELQARGFITLDGENVKYRLPK
jgi:hypothetical protein